MNYQNKYGFIGWREFLTNRKEILDEFDKASEKNISRPIRVLMELLAKLHLENF